MFIIKENEGKATVKEINCPELNSSSYLEFKDIFLPKQKGTVFPLRTDRGAGGVEIGKWRSIVEGQTSFQQILNANGPTPMLNHYGISREKNNFHAKDFKTECQKLLRSNSGSRRLQNAQNR